MMRPLVMLEMLFLTGCLQLETGGSNAGASGATDGGGDAAVLVPLRCAREAETGEILCSQVSPCPARLDATRFPHCGFRKDHDFALACVCATSLCSIAAASSCAEATTALAALQSEDQICSQLAEGRCIELRPDAGAGKSGCDRNCRDSCAGEPSCFTLCGC